MERASRWGPGLVMVLALSAWPAVAEEPPQPPVEQPHEVPAAAVSQPAAQATPVGEPRGASPPAGAREARRPWAASAWAGMALSSQEGPEDGARSPARQARPRSPSGGTVGSDTGRRAASPPPAGAPQADRRRHPPSGSDGAVVVGRAVPRGSVPTRPVYVGHRGYYRYPYYASYGYWYPWGFGTWGLGFYWWDAAWYGGWGWPAPYPYGRYGYYYPDRRADLGAVRVLVKPRDAQVFVDGYYVGVVDEFDGYYQRLYLETGPRRIEVRKEGFETLRFDVRVVPGHTVKLRGELRPAPPVP